MKIVLILIAVFLSSCSSENIEIAEKQAILEQITNDLDVDIRKSVSDELILSNRS